MVPSEHTFEGEPADVELQFHFTGSGRSAIASIFFSVDEGSPGQGSNFIDALNLDSDDDIESLPLNDLFAQAGEGRITFYEGSNGKDFCPTAVDWFIFENILTISQE